ncbi:MAG: DMT family transporter [Spirochaetota bacterium]
MHRDRTAADSAGASAQSNHASSLDKRPCGSRSPAPSVDRVIYFGVGMLLLSALLFAGTTVFVKLAAELGDVSGRTAAFVRFLFGLLVVAVYFGVQRRSLLPRKPRWVVLRVTANTLAVVLFFSGIELTTVTSANMLNMTYPVFVFAVAPLINREPTPRVYYLFLTLTLAGIWLVLFPAEGAGFSEINAGDLLALGSAGAAAVAISALREARKHDDSPLILFYLFLFGTMASFFVMLPGFRIPPAGAAGALLGVGFCAFAGQLTLTVGYRYISAAGGSIVSAARIVFAAVLGTLVFADPLGWKTILGGTLIVMSLLGVSGVVPRLARGRATSGATERLPEVDRR